MFGPAGLSSDSGLGGSTDGSTDILVFGSVVDSVTEEGVCSLNISLDSFVVFTFKILLTSLPLFLCSLTFRGGVGGVVQRWGGNRTRGAIRPWRPERTLSWGVAPSSLTSPQLTPHGRGVSSRCWCTRCKRGGRGKDAADPGCDGGERA